MVTGVIKSARVTFMLVFGADSRDFRPVCMVLNSVSNCRPTACEEWPSRAYRIRFRLRKSPSAAPLDERNFGEEFSLLTARIVHELGFLIEYHGLSIGQRMLVPCRQTVVIRIAMAR